MVNYSAGSGSDGTPAAKTANYTATSTDYYIGGDASITGAFTVTIPVTGVTNGKAYLVKKTDSGSNTVTVQPASGQIDGQLGAITLLDGGDYTRLTWDGSVWRVTGGFSYIGGLRTKRTVLDDANPGNLQLFAAGSGLQLTEGANCKQGTAVLNGTTAVVVSNTSVTANSRIYLTIQTPGGTVGAPYVSAIVAATSFSVKSTAAGDTSTVAYMIVEHT